MRPAIDQSIVFTYPDDLDAAAHFFGEVMELDLVVDQGACRIYRLTASSFLGVCILPGRTRSGEGVMITIVSDDVVGWHDFLISKGVEYLCPPQHKNRFGIYTSLFISPHGYRIEIQRFDKAGWCDP